MGSFATPRILFLHGGPGMTAELERRQLGAASRVHWWDQPKVGLEASCPLETIVEAASEELTRLCRECAGPVDLLANAFGAYLARALIERIPERIGAVTICSGVWDLATSILRLVWRFIRLGCDGDLERLSRQALARSTPESYFEIFARVSAMPGFLDCFWSPSAQEPREAMIALAAEGRLIDWPTCQAVMIATLARPYSVLPPSQRREVRILLGEFDPCFEERDTAVWQALWPKATVQVVQAGQFPHLELPPSIWMPGGEAEA